MHLERFWTNVANWLTLSPINAAEAQQFPILGDLDGSFNVPKPHYPIFKPPGGRPSSDFKCNYKNMPGWKECSTPENRSCWLRHEDGREFNINTNYEDYAPIGIDRNYTLVLNDGSLNADGQTFSAAKLFNNTYPGPWIEACWGDVSTKPGHRYYIMKSTV
jgi:hypothetical protein